MNHAVMQDAVMQEAVQAAMYGSSLAEAPAIRRADERRGLDGVGDLGGRDPDPVRAQEPGELDDARVHVLDPNGGRSGRRWSRPGGSAGAAAGAGAPRGAPPRPPARTGAPRPRAQRAA